MCVCVCVCVCVPVYVYTCVCVSAVTGKMHARCTDTMRRREGGDGGGKKGRLTL